MSRTVKVCTMGVDERLANALRSICALSRHPGRAVAFEISQPESADICVLDPDTAGAPTAWQGLDPGHTKPVLMIEPVTGKPPAEAHVIGRPVMAARLMARLDLLAREVANDRVANHQAAAHQRATARGHCSVLVCDDSVTIRTQVEQVLRESGFSPTLVETGEEAMRLAMRYRFDVLLLDVVLPGADGYHVCRTIKKQLRHRAPAIVMLTGKSSPFDKVRGSLAGCDSYLTKPTSPAELRAALERYAGNGPADGARTATAAA